MEQPFRKRPRLSMFSSDDQLDEDLGCRRTRNDLLLKSRFESIFEKYSHDFTGVGDEIDMDSLAIVVNNGHLQSMENETDPGGLHNARGQTLLRAMTEALGDQEEDYHNTDADEVMESIEEMAENAAIPEDQEETTPMDSDEELFLPVPSRAMLSTPSESHKSQDIAQYESISSDHDSLFDGRQSDRSGSPDSLFAVQQRHSSGSTPFELTPPEEVDDEAILRQFGPKIGQEVLSVIRQAKNAAYQAHIEPAWRVPTIVNSPEPTRTISKSKTPPASMLPPPELQQISSPDHATSLWKPARHRSTKRAMHQARVKQRIRAESEDPLQQIFDSDKEDTQPDADADEDASDASYREEKESGSDRPKQRKRKQVDNKVLQMREGSCFYCHRKWTHRNGVFKHWVKLATQFDKGEIDDDDVHDLDYIHVYVASSNRAPRAPRLSLSDFKTMVELHEGTGLSFHEIASLGVLRTRKAALALNDVYDRYRNQSDLAVENTAEWSPEDLETLQKLCLNPEREMSTFAQSFKDRSNTDVGDKLAEIWLGQLIDSGQISAKAMRQEKPQTTEPVKSDNDGVRPKRRRGSSNDELFIKPEPVSDDELFGSR